MRVPLPPPEDHINLNVDGPFQAADGTVDTGMIVRDHRGGALAVVTAVC